MPEFAEVNYQVKWLRERVRGWKLTKFEASGKQHFPELKDDPKKEQTLKGFFEGSSIDNVTQRGKFVVFRLSSGTMTAHLMFKGRWSLKGQDFTSNYKHHKEAPTEKSVNFWAEGPSGRLNFHEPERQGKVHVYPGLMPGKVEELEDLGPEALVTPETDPDYSAVEWGIDKFKAQLAKTKVVIKSFLLDQKKQAGLGNMYVCEALYRAKVDPGRPSNSLNASEAQLILDSAKAILKQSIETKLDYGKVLAVYRREKDPEGREVVMSEVGGRDTFWVPSVQK